MFAILKLNISNLTSICNALDNLNVKYDVTDDYKKINQSAALIIPGVGAFGSAMKLLEEKELKDHIYDYGNKRPILGICLGMQMLFENSEETPEVRGISLIEGSIKKMPRKKLPTIGWCETKQINDIPYFQHKDDLMDFYYIHSYSSVPKDKSIITLETKDNIVGGIKKDNIFGYQFHPEKSQKYGLEIINSFVQYVRHY